MKNFVRLIGPSLMILIGLQLLESVAVTFVLFYSWLLAVPLIDKAFPKEIVQVTKQAVILGFGSGLLFFLFVFGGLKWLHTYLLDIGELRTLLLKWGFSGPGEIGLVLVLLLANPILEEWYWRGYIYEKLRANGKAVYTILMTASFYTLYHLLSVIPMFQGISSVAAILPVLIAGIFWGYTREKTGSIIAAVISHVLGDLGIVASYWFILR
ncbi:CPBP family intramembrane metalloprotease [Domibacillus sp. PGB-M46]|uniref:CPBP family intramembrane glutamic endopeptidase n=1 Tax=Domibacillus sp. PGB-M46 TaxID=2910255 RepID=UPI001F56F6C0|nr:type II CAAX endopeptidase family protein [Domibacillus sp. PGB-M46]MCI2256647.1 CPBP family intramembrane metalloprotease [Domibacillus sp. PGB-M46]